MATPTLSMQIHAEAARQEGLKKIRSEAAKKAWKTRRARSKRLAKVSKPQKKLLERISKPGVYLEVRYGIWRTYCTIKDERGFANKDVNMRTFYALNDRRFLKALGEREKRKIGAHMENGEWVDDYEVFVCWSISDKGREVVNVR